MINSKIIKIIASVIGIILIAIVCVLWVSYYQYTNAHKTENKHYKNYIGYIDQAKALLNDKHKLCDEGRIIHTYSSAGYKTYTGSKKQFRETILSEYKNRNYLDSGYLNFRFLVNCEGHAGWFEIIEMNLDLEESPLNKDMVNQLFELTSNSKHWNVVTYENTPYNYYMYISYRIEHGEIIEIIP